jgi:hypothetical protein
LSLLVTFWIYTNKQMFSNVIDPVDSQDQITYSHHLITNFKWKDLQIHQKEILIAIIIFSVLLLVYKMFD